jgi:hypothetical protein
MNGKYANIPDVHFDEVVPEDELKLGNPDNEPDEESAESVAETKKLYKDLFDIDLDDLFDEDGNVKPDE